MEDPTIGDFHNRLRAVEDKLARVTANPAPTIPSLDSTNFPQDAVYGQIAKDINDHSMWVYGEDDTWHKIGQGDIAAIAQGYNGWFGGSSMTVPAGTTVNASFNTVAVGDPTVFEWQTVLNPNDALHFFKDGAYIVKAQSIWPGGSYFRKGAIVSGADSLVAGIDTITNRPEDSVGAVSAVATDDIAIINGAHGITFQLTNSGGSDRNVVFWLRAVYIPLVSI